MISLGTVEIGLDYGLSETGSAKRPDEAAAAKLLHRALDLGINFLDTARLYGESEAIIGRALRSRRSEFFLASKVPSFQSEGLEGAVLRGRVMASVHESLHFLQTDTIDLMLIHSAPAEVIVRGEVAEALEELKKSGCIRHIGASVYGEETALQAIECGQFDCVQLAYSALDRRTESRVFPAARAKDVGIVARSVLLRGALTDRRRHLPDSLAALKSSAERLADLARGEAESLPELSYRYVLSHEPPHTALVGALSIGEVEAAIGFAERGPLSSELVARMQGVRCEREELLNPGTWATA